MNASFAWLGIDGLEKVARNTYLLSFSQSPDNGRVLPGQFCMLSPPPGSADFFLPRPFSYFRIVNGKSVELLFRVVGKATRWMSGLKPGSGIGVFGPLGNHFNLAPQAERVFLLGGGIGLPPLVMLGQYLASLENPPRVDLIYGEARGAMLVDPYPYLPPGVNLHLCSEDGSQGFRGKVTEAFAPLLGQCSSPPAVYMCGPRAMMAAVTGMLEPGQVLFLEASLEEIMACGKGICQGCVIPCPGGDGAVKYVRCCTEGPVFNAFEVLWPSA